MRINLFFNETGGINIKFFIFSGRYIFKTDLILYIYFINILICINHY